MLALALVAVWSVVPILCVQHVEAAEVHVHGQASTAFHEHDDGENEHGNSCCKTVVSAKFLAAPAVVAPVAKVVSVPSEAVVVEQQTSTASLESQTIHGATGPPLSRLKRLLTYSALAPPALAA